MPIIKSAKKRARQEVVRKERNAITRRQIKDTRKELAAAKKSANDKKTEEALKAYQSALDTAVKKNVIHKNKAARLLSRASVGTPKKKPTKSAKVATKKVAPKKVTAKKPVAKKGAPKKKAA